MGSPPSPSKRCSACKLTKGIDEFWKNQTRCIDCKTAWYRENFNPIAATAKRYGLTEQILLNLLEGQDGLCAICQLPPPDGQVLHVDHDHRCCPGRKSCGKCVRGLLCRPCNVKLAALENERWRASAEWYLEGTL